MYFSVWIFSQLFLDLADEWFLVVFRDGPIYFIEIVQHFLERLIKVINISITCKLLIFVEICAYINSSLLCQLIRKIEIELTTIPITGQYITTTPQQPQTIARKLKDLTDAATIILPDEGIPPNIYQHVTKTAGIALRSTANNR